MKTKNKILIVFFIALFTILTSATNVKAVEVPEERVKQAFEAIPDELEIDIKDCDYRTIQMVVTQKLDDIWKEKGLYYYDFYSNFSYDGAPVYYVPSRGCYVVFEGDITLTANNNTINFSKTIKLKYSGGDLKKEAEEYEKKLQKMLDVLPNNMDINLKETDDWVKAQTEIEKQTKDIWKQNGIDTTGVEFEVDRYVLYFTSKNFRKARIKVCGDLREYDNIILNGRKATGEKEITVKFNDTYKYDPADEQTIKNLKLVSPKYYEVPVDDYIHFADDVTGRGFLKITEDYYTKQINDPSITVQAYIGASDGGVNYYIGEGGVVLLIYKNGIFYDRKVIGYKGYERFIPVITVPQEMTEEELSDYILNLDFVQYWTKYWWVDTWNNDDSAMPELSLVKGVLKNHYYDFDIPDAYTICYNGGAGDVVIVRREESDNHVQVQDSDTNIKLEAESGVVPNDTVLKVEIVKDGADYNTAKSTLSNVKNFVMYDISLLSNGVEIQPNGNVKISIPIPKDFDKSRLVVYRIADNGVKVEYNVTVEGDYAIFETDHFSNYVLAETDRQLDDEPKAGRNNDIEMTSLIALVSLAGILITRKIK